MALFGSLVEWTKQHFMPYGSFGLFSLAFIESTVFPIPPDVLLIPLVLASPEAGLFFAFITTLGSVLGAIAGYWLGWRGGRPVLSWMVSDRNMERAEAYYDRYGVLAVTVAGFSPIPYKVFTVTSGAFRMNFSGFVAASVVSRGARFFIEAIVLMVWGDSILWFLNQYLGPLSLVLLGGMFVAYFVYKEFL